MRYLSKRKTKLCSILGIRETLLKQGNGSRKVLKYQRAVYTRKT